MITIDRHFELSELKICHELPVKVAKHFVISHTLIFNILLEAIRTFNYQMKYNLALFSSGCV